VSSCGLGVFMDTEHLLVTDLEVDTALADLTVPLAVRTVWQLLSESDVRLDEAVALDVPDVELTDRLVVLHDTKEGGAYEAEITATAAAALAELIGSRPSGPVFTVEARRLRKEEVAARFRAITGKSVHALRFTQEARRHRSTARPQLVARTQPGEETAAPA
jgi:integrase